MKMQEIFEGISGAMNQNSKRPANQGYMRNSRPEFEVDGYKFFVEYQEDPDGFYKRFHYVVDPRGEYEHDMDWSPYDNPTEEDVRLWIELGMPSRKDLGMGSPIGRKDLEQYAQQSGAQ